MFAEHLKREDWEVIMPGVSVCRYPQGKDLGQLPLQMEYAHSEAFFCWGGSMTIHRSSGGQLHLEGKEILLVSDCRQITSVEIQEPLEGVVLSVDQLQAGESFRELCRQFGNLDLSMKKVGEHMAAGGGVRLVPSSPWSRAAFYALKRLPAADQGHYIIIKTFELLYLVCTQDAEGPVCEHDSSGSLSSVAESMKVYMEEHMDEKLTITELSRRFHLSRTACKSAFRECFGQPIHSWLLDRRMERAAELLEHTKMPILQVAQAVGYTGVSQFNVAFRQRYGKSPREYRKMSISAVY